MRKISLTEAAKKALVIEYGADAVKIDKELTELSALVIKRKDRILAANRSEHKKDLKEYYKVDEEIKKLITKINIKLAV